MGIADTRQPQAKLGKQLRIIQSGIGIQHHINHAAGHPITVGGGHPGCQLVGGLWHVEAEAKVACTVIQISGALCD
ncbi:hypothetical protein D3C85_1772530 [compost metagenome]